MDKNQCISYYYHCLVYPAIFIFSYNIL